MWNGLGKAFIYYHKFCLWLPEGLHTYLCVKEVIYKAGFFLLLLLLNPLLCLKFIQLILQKLFTLIIITLNSFIISLKCNYKIM